MKDAGLPFRDGLHAASHALLNVVPLYMMCNATDMAAECDNPYDTRFRPERLLLYDKHPGGIGIAAQVRHNRCCCRWASCLISYHNILEYVSVCGCNGQMATHGICVFPVTMLFEAELQLCVITAACCHTESEHQVFMPLQCIGHKDHRKSTAL